MRPLRSVALAVACGASVVVPFLAQWLEYPTEGVPRLAEQSSRRMR